MGCKFLQGLLAQLNVMWHLSGPEGGRVLALSELPFISCCGVLYCRSDECQEGAISLGKLWVDFLKCGTS